MSPFSAPWVDDFSLSEWIQPGLSTQKRSERDKENDDTRTLGGGWNLEMMDWWRKHGLWESMGSVIKVAN